jgi:hypothetical protein
MHIEHVRVLNLYILGEIAVKNGDYKDAEEYWVKAIHLGREIDARELSMIEQRLYALSKKEYLKILISHIWNSSLRQMSSWDYREKYVCLK